MTDLGELSLWIALLMAAWGTAVSFAGGAFGRDDLLASGARGILVGTFFVALAAAGLCWALLGDDFSLRYVGRFSNEELPAPYKLSAAWAGSEGALLLFAVVLATAATIALRTSRRSNRDLMPWVAGSLALVLAIALAVSATRWSPFERVSVAAADGRGLDPRLQDPLAAARVPLLYCGCAAACVALALTLAAAVKRRFDAQWRRALRVWLAVAWCFAATSALLALRIRYMEGGASGFRPWRRVAAAVEIPDGGTARVTDPFGREWSFTSQGASHIERPNHFLTAVSFRTTQARSRPRFITSEIREYYGRDDRERFAPWITPGIGVFALEDVVVRLESVAAGQASVRIEFVPFVSLVWLGGVALLLGGAMALWPARAAREGLA